MNFDVRIEQILNEINTGLELVDEAPDYHLRSGISTRSPLTTLKTKDGLIIINNTPTVELPYEDALNKKIFNTTFTSLLKSLVKNYKCIFEKVYITVGKVRKKTGDILSTRAIVEGLDPYGNKIYLVKSGKTTLNTVVYFDDFSKAAYVAQKPTTPYSIAIRWFVEALHPKIEKYTVKQILKLILKRGSKYYIHPNGVIDVQGDVEYTGNNYTGPLKLVNVQFKKIPFKFGKVSGSATFEGDIGDGENLPVEIEKNLTIYMGGYTIKPTLNHFNISNFPKYVGGNLRLHGLDIESLQNFPRVNANDAEIELQALPHLTSLKGFPSNFSGAILITNCVSLTSLEGLPNIIAPSAASLGRTAALDLRYLNSLKNLIGMPEVVKGNVAIEDCTALTSLEGISKVIEGDLFIEVDSLGIKNNWEEEFRKHNLGDVVQGKIQFSRYSWSSKNKPIDKTNYSQAYKDALYKGGLEDVPIDI